MNSTVYAGRYRRVHTGVRAVHKFIQLYEQLRSLQLLLYDRVCIREFWGIWLYAQRQLFSIEHHNEPKFKGIQCAKLTGCATDVKRQ